MPVLCSSTSSSPYLVEIDAVDRDEWSSILTGFDDATIYQTWSYGSFRWGERNLSHAIMKRGGDVVGAAQVRIVRLPIVGAGIANVKWGPLWRRRTNEDPAVFREMLVALQNEYMIKRGLLLRIVPNQVCESTGAMRSMLMAEGFRPEPAAVPYNTLVMDLSPSLDELRRGLRKNWSQHLGQAERRGLIIQEGNSDELFETVIRLYNDMLARKGFVSFLNIDEFRAMQSDLKEHLKMKTIVCEVDGAAVAARVVSQIGDAAVDLIAATNSAGLKTKASYIVFWRVIEWLKSAGCRWYDLGGIDPEANQGVYQFKTGLAGKNGREVSFEEFEQSSSVLSSSVVRMGDRLRALLRKSKGSLKGNPQ
ncbi:conserved hypothetical protein [Candidatus Sulfobium mesophilum]|uniref:BioF2-like acetyltransferase domain-containing protein n=1 Tax=Candidatus Sulfobium mesophilum TaxID=2016548 RepID=A0A2U3QDN7_9BACT|nr:conserved hypothetical protein [Candidatus Sulfobium mesophilum]